MLEMIVFAVTFVVTSAITSVIVTIGMTKWFMRKETIKHYTKMMVEISNEIAEELDV